jgi:hypothetical protein
LLIYGFKDYGISWMIVMRSSDMMNTLNVYLYIVSLDIYAHRMLRKSFYCIIDIGQSVEFWSNCFSSLTIVFVIVNA